MADPTRVLAAASALPVPGLRAAACYPTPKRAVPELPETPRESGTTLVSGADRVVVVLAEGPVCGSRRPSVGRNLAAGRPGARPWGASPGPRRNGGAVAVPPLLPRAGSPP